MILQRAVPLVLSVLCLGLFGCSKNGDGTGGSGIITRPGFGSVKISMTDAPADYDEVNVVIREVRIHAAGAGGQDSWFVVRPDEPTTYDLLDLQNGVFVTLGFARGTIPAGSYDMVQLVLGDGSTVVVDGVTHDLRVPSGTIRLRGDFEVPDEGEVELLLDFDAARSVHKAGPSYMLKPMIRMTVAEAAGSIRGNVDPDTEAMITVSQNGTVVATSQANAEGEFTIAALATGTYTVRIEAEGYEDVTIETVEVTAGETTDLGTVTVTAVPAS